MLINLHSTPETTTDLLNPAANTITTDLLTIYQFETQLRDEKEKRSKSINVFTATDAPQGTSVHEVAEGWRGDAIECAAARGWKGGLEKKDTNGEGREAEEEEVVRSQEGHMERVVAGRCM